MAPKLGKKHLDSEADKAGQVEYQKRLIESHQRKCPSCGCRNAATIQYGLPIFSAQLERDIESGLIFLGGCCSSSASPDLYCNVCGKKWKGYSRFSPVSSIVDWDTGLEWASTLSPTPLTYEKAVRYATEISATNDDDKWRLPTEAELLSLVDITKLSDDPKAYTYPLFEPFNAHNGKSYLHTGELVHPQQESDGNFILNVRNGHLINGKGYTCYVLSVRNAPIGTRIRLLIERSVK